MITIRALHSPSEMAEAVRLQHHYWGNNASDLVPAHMLLSIARYGGHVHAAFDGDKLVGLLMGFLGANIRPDDDGLAANSLYIMSKRMVVLADYRGQQIGERLKQAQYDYAQRHGIALVLWTYDPLLSVNAYLNLHKLGAVGQRYERDYFGSDSDNPVLSADRLQVNWWVGHPHVKQGLAIDLRELTLSKSHDDWRVPQAVIDHDRYCLLEIPANFREIEASAPALASQWRQHVRQHFTDLMQRGYLATDFIRHNGHMLYVFTEDDGTFRF